MGLLTCVHFLMWGTLAEEERWGVRKRRAKELGVGGVMQSLGLGGGEGRKD